MKIQLSNKAKKQLEKISKADKKLALQVKNAIIESSNNPYENPKVKMLTGDFKGYFRIRVRDYRIIFTIESNTMLIATINNRKDTYNG